HLAITASSGLLSPASTGWLATGRGLAAVRSSRASAGNASGDAVSAPPVCGRGLRFLPKRFGRANMVLSCDTVGRLPSRTSHYRHFSQADYRPFHALPVILVTAPWPSSPSPLLPRCGRRGSSK